MENMTALSPSLQSHVLTADKLISLSMKYSKVIENIQPIDGLDIVKLEIKRFITDDDVMELKKDNFEKFWKDVSELKDGAADWPRYEILPRLALALGTKHDATGDVERSFSTMNIIHQNKQRNSMEQDTLNAHMHIKTGVEGKEIIETCPKCEVTPKTPHCHCDLMKISEQMRANCKAANMKCINAQKASANVRKEASAEMKERKEESEKLEKERREKVKTDIVTKKQFGPSKLFEPIYVKTDKKGDGSKSSVDNSESSVGCSKSSVGSSKSSVGSSKSSVVSSKSSSASGGSKSTAGNIGSSSSKSKQGSSFFNKESNNNKKRKAGDR